MAHLLLILSVVLTSAFALVRPVAPRTVLTGCTGKDLAMAQEALDDCGKLTGPAIQTIRYGDPDVFFKYFRTTEQSVRNFASFRIRAINFTCPRRMGQPWARCTPNDGVICNPGVLTRKRGSDLFDFCPSFFEMEPAMPTECHKPSRASEVVKRFAMLPNIYPNLPGIITEYANTWEGIQNLSAAQGAVNAESFAMFVSDLYLGCV